MDKQISSFWRDGLRCALVGAFGAAIGLGAAHAASDAGAELTITVVDSDGEPVAGALVTLASGSDAPSGSDGPSTDAAVIDQADLRFRPYVTAVPVGGQVRFVNSDQTGHHVYSFSRAKRFEVTVDSGGEAGPIGFDQPGLVPIGCNIHDNMLAYIYVVEKGPFGVTDEHGVARLDGLSSGEVDLRIRHPDARKRRGVTIAANLGSTETIQAEIEVRSRGGGTGRRDRIEY